MNKLSSPPLSSSSRSRDKSGNISWSDGSSSLSLATLMNCHMMDITVWEVSTWESLCSCYMIHITEWIVWTWQLRLCHRGLWTTSRSLDKACFVDFVIFSQESIITIWVGGTEGLQVIWELSSHEACQSKSNKSFQLKTKNFYAD